MQRTRNGGPELATEILEIDEPLADEQRVVDLLNTALDQDASVHAL